MATESIGELVPTKIPGYADAADIQAALRVYHYGTYDFDINETNTTNLVSPSMAYTINDIQNQIDNIDTIGTAVLTSKGALISASSASTPSILAVGSNGKVLTANSGTTTGLEWAAPEVTLSNSITFSNKTISGLSNTLTNIANASLVNSSITINGTAVDLGNSVTLEHMPDVIMLMGC
jgi:hypothetical protein